MVNTQNGKKLGDCTVNEGFTLNPPQPLHGVGAIYCPHCPEAETEAQGGWQVSEVYIQTQTCCVHSAASQMILTWRVQSHFLKKEHRPIVSRGEVGTVLSSSSPIWQFGIGPALPVWNPNSSSHLASHGNLRQVMQPFCVSICSPIKRE